ncbi:MAG: Clp protease N-terminal domain-containing protein, partial [Patescibacteria group bacterium]|nr:Clp protease N-terminal domain-containing protein [Patescibacteria group bacterium]
MENLNTTEYKEVLRFASEVAREENRQVGTEHLLIGVLYRRHTSGAQILANFGLNLEEIGLIIDTLDRRRFHENKGADNMTAQSLAILELIYEIAEEFNTNYIGTEHIILAILRYETCNAVKILKDLKVNMDDLLSKYLKLFGDIKNTQSSVPGVLDNMIKMLG